MTQQQLEHIENLLRQKANLLEEIHIYERTISVTPKDPIDTKLRQVMYRLECRLDSDSLFRDVKEELLESITQVVQTYIESVKSVVEDINRQLLEL